MSWIFVDTESTFGIRSPGFEPNGGMTEFGAVEYNSEQTFHGILPGGPRAELVKEWLPVMLEFGAWLDSFSGKPVFWSDNPAWDFQWINYHFCHLSMENPFGHSGRRISDLYAGLTGRIGNTQEWKKWRKPKHDHHPVHDALGNVRAMKRFLDDLKGGNL